MTRSRSSSERSRLGPVPQGGLAALRGRPPRDRPELLAPGRLRQLGDQAREDYDEARHDWHANFGILHTPQLAAVHDEPDMIVTAGRQDPDRVRGAAVIDALPGLGKTTAANAFARAFDRAQVRRHGPLTSEGNERVPVFRVGLTSNTTLRTLNRMICEFYGHPGANRANAAQLASHALDCVLSCETRIGIIDDVHFVDPRSKDGLDVSNHLKWLAPRALADRAVPGGRDELADDPQVAAVEDAGGRGVVGGGKRALPDGVLRYCLQSA